jgi:anti-sigma factor RsiW
MDTKLIERLLVDRHLGELPDDVSELLDAYIADKPEYSRLHRELTRMLTLAGQTLNSPPLTDEPMPVLAPHRPSATPSPRRRFGIRMWLRTGALAAALALSFILGARTSESPRGSTLQNEVLVRAVSGHDRNPQAGFWSLSRLQESTSHRPSAGKTNRIDWNAPFSPTWTGERS